VGANTVIDLRFVAIATSRSNESVEVDRTTWSPFSVTLADDRNRTRPRSGLDPPKRSFIEHVHALDRVLEIASLQGRSEGVEMGAKDVPSNASQERGDAFRVNLRRGEDRQVSQVYTASRFELERDEDHRCPRFGCHPSGNSGDVHDDDNLERRTSNAPSAMRWNRDTPPEMQPALTESLRDPG